MHLSAYTRINFLLFLSEFISLPRFNKFLILFIIMFFRKNSVLSISDLTLLVLDECHHTKAGHMHMKVMQFVLDAKQREAKDLPQVMKKFEQLIVEQSRTMGIIVFAWIFCKVQDYKLKLMN